MIPTFKGSEKEQAQGNNCEYNFENEKSSSRIFIITVHTSEDSGDARMKESTIDNILLFSSVDYAQEANEDKGSSNN